MGRGGIVYGRVRSVFPIRPCMVSGNEMNTVSGYVHPGVSRRVFDITNDQPRRAVASRTQGSTENRTGLMFGRALTSDHLALRARIPVALGPATYSRHASFSEPFFSGVFFF